MAHHDQITSFRLDHPAGPFDVSFTDADRAAVMTPSNWGTYPELRATVNRARQYAIHAYFHANAAGQWVLETFHMTHAAGRAISSPAMIAAKLLAGEVLGRAIAEHPDAPGRAGLAATAQKRARLTADLHKVTGERDAIVAQLAELQGPEASPVATGGPGESLHHAVRSFLAYVDATDQEDYLDTGDVLDFVPRFRAALDVLTAEQRATVARETARHIERALGDNIDSGACFAIVDAPVRGARALVTRDVRTHDAATSDQEIMIAVVRGRRVRAI